MGNTPQGPSTGFKQDIVGDSSRARVDRFDGEERFEICSFGKREPPRRSDQIRTKFGPGYSIVTAYPSVGGIFVARCSPVELEYLGLSRTTEEKRSTPKGENELVRKMLHLGATWWPSWEFYQRHYEAATSGGIPYTTHFPPMVAVGFPSSGGGVWVRKFAVDSNELPARAKQPPYLDLLSSDWDARISMPLNMDERCEVLRQFGAVHYDGLDDCEDIPKTIDQAVERGEGYEVLCQKMDDYEYVAEWLGDKV